MSQCIILGKIDAKEILQQIIVDDGLPSRNNRKALLNPVYKHFGCYSGRNECHQHMTCIIYSSEFYELSPIILQGEEFKEPLHPKLWVCFQRCARYRSDLTMRDW